MTQTPEADRLERAGVRFQCGYQGCSNYVWKGRRFDVYFSVMDYQDGHWNYTPEEYGRQVRARCGTVMWDEVGLRHEFPPPELVALFPGYVGARYNADFSAVEYDGVPPEVEHSAVYRSTLPKVRADEFRSMGWAV